MNPEPSIPTLPPGGTGLASQGSPVRRSPNLVPIVALGAILLLCVCGGIGFLGLNALDIVKVQVNLFRTATPTFVAVAATPTALASAPPLATFEPTDAPPPATSPPLVTGTPTAVAPTSELSQSYVAFDADLFGECPLYEGDSEVRAYKCDSGKYSMRHKQATTRYAFYDAEYRDGVIQANGYFADGTGKYEYGIVFRANSEGTLYYVFTVTGDGRYNVALYRNEKYTDLIPYTASPYVNTGKSNSNELRVVMRGSRFDFYLNDHFVGTVEDATIPGGVAGLFFYNDEPDAEVDFTGLTISTFAPPTPTATAGSQNITPTPGPAVAEATVVPVKPGIHVDSLRLSPRAPRRGEPVTFFARFINSTGRAQNVKWFVEIWDAAADKKNAYGQADGQQREIPVGTNERATGDSWKVAGGGPCLAFRARVVYEDDQSRRIPFQRANGSDLWTPFQVCP